MKKTILSIALCGGILASVGTAVIVHADDTKTGTTEVTSKVLAGDISLLIDNSVNFGEKTLAKEVDFGSKDVNFTVTDYTGAPKGFTIQAVLKDEDAKRVVTVGDKELSKTATQVYSVKANNNGDNIGKVAATLKYTGLDTAKVYTTNIEWTLSAGTSKAISE